MWSPLFSVTDSTDDKLQQITASYCWVASVCVGGCSYSENCVDILCGEHLRGATVLDGCSDHCVYYVLL